MQFKRPVRKGEIAGFQNQIVYAGNTSLVTHIPTGDILDGFISFVHVNTNGNPLSHGIIVEATTEDEKELQKCASDLRKK